MTHRRRAAEATPTSQETVGRLGVAVPASPQGDVSVRDFVVAGGLRGLTAQQMFPERTA